jgi:type II secretory ATPase GspE/PulE/Tfp pilus assembly ATPase PilB-like protein
LKGGANPPPERQPGLPAESEQTAQALIEQCLEAAVQLRASDVHVEPQLDKLAFRLRVDGLL